MLTEEVRERARLLSADAPFARDNFARIADGASSDGLPEDPIDSDGFCRHEFA